MSYELGGTVSLDFPVTGVTCTIAIPLPGVADEDMKHCVLMVEDEMYLAMILKDLLSDAGYRVLCAARLNDAMRLAQEESIDAAVLDINLHGEVVQ